MSGLGTDVLALACIVGGAAVSGGATLAALRAEPPQRCETQTIAIPRVVVGVGEARDVVVGPRVVRVESAHGCAAVLVGSDVDVRVDEARVRVERARVRVERARERIGRARERAEMARERAEGMRETTEAMREAIEETRLLSGVSADEIRAKYEKELASIERELARQAGGAEGR